nr:putative collagen-binding domain-containing protein [Paenibacillus periandrae]
MHRPVGCNIIQIPFHFIKKYLSEALPQTKTIVLDGQDRNWCLAAHGKLILIYMLEGGNVSLELPPVDSALACRWFDPRTGDILDGGTVGPGGSGCVKFMDPDLQDWLLWISPLIR